jgi:hypothetical protein
MSDRQKALWWHRVAFALACVVVVVEAIGLVWSESHNGPALVETRPRA